MITITNARERRVKITAFAPLDVTGIESESGWYLVAFRPGTNTVLANTSAKSLTEAITNLTYELAQIQEQIDRAAKAADANVPSLIRAAFVLDLCDCGSPEGTHACDPSTVRMDTPDMMGLEPEVASIQEAFGGKAGA